MMNLQRKIFVLIAATGCFVCFGLSYTTQAQTKTAAKTQKSLAKTPPVKPAAKPAIKTEAKSAAKSLKPFAATKPPQPKSLDKSKNAPSAKKTLPEKKKSATAENTENAREKNVREKNRKEKTDNQKSFVKTASVATKPARKDSTLKPAKIAANLRASEKPPIKKPDESSRLIVAATSARVRDEPNAAAKTVSTIEFGRILTVSDQNAAWSKVRISVDKSGWISKSVVADFEDSRRAEIYRKILGKYFKDNKPDFAEAAQIFDFLKTALTQVKKTDDKADLSFKSLFKFSRSELF